MDFGQTRSSASSASFSALFRVVILGALPLSCSCGEGGTIAARGVLSIEGAEIDFGEVPVLASRTRTLRLSNTGRGRLSLGDFRISPEEAPLVIERTPSSLASGETAELTLRCTPTTQGALDAVLTFSSDDSDVPSVSIPVRAVSSTQGKLQLSADLDFSGVCEGASRTGTVTLNSVGSAPLDVTGVSIETASDPVGTADSTGFFLPGSSRLPLTIPPGEQAAFAVRLSPAYGSPASFAAVLTLETTDPEQPRTEIPLTATVDRAPSASIAELPPAAPGSVLALDGTSSSDPENAGPLSFSWKVVSAPAGSASVIEGSDAASASFVIDEPGDYGFSLTVTDAAGCVSPEAEAAISARTAEGLRFELFWDNLDADLDLHLIPDGKAFFGAEDCYFSEGHAAPDWGTPGDADDDPFLVRDALNGYGPEIISYPSPAAGTYRAMAHYFSAHHSLSPAAAATLRVYRFGVLTAEVSRVLEGKDDVWEAVSVDWPGGVVTLLDAGGSGQGEGGNE